jgi:hypothetical protein
MNVVKQTRIVRRIIVFPACVLALFASPARADIAPPFKVPPGFRVTASRQIAPGLTHATLTRRSPAAVVNVAARAPDSAARLEVMLSNDAVGGPEPRREAPSSMCARVHCLAAVNADFFGDAESQPVGGVVIADQLLRSPNARHHQLVEADDGTLSTAQMSWRGKIVPSDLEQLELDAVNRPRNANDLVLYTPAQGPSTGANRYGAELVLQVVRPSGPVLLGRTTLVRMLELRHEGDTPIPADGAVLSGHGRGQRMLENLWARVQEGKADADALLRLDVDPDARESVGGSPILVRDGKRWFADDGRTLYALRSPRTMAGWTRDGTLMLVTVDGRQGSYSAGMTMSEAADLMVDLGAVEALNFDGGGSTAFVVNGSVVNQPSDRAVRRSGKTVVVRSPRPGEKVVGYVERPVAIAVGFVGPRQAAPLLKGGLPVAPHASLVSPLAGGRGAGASLVLSGPGLDGSALALVLAAVCVAVLGARLRRAPQPG